MDKPALREQVVGRNIAFAVVAPSTMTSKNLQEFEDGH
jgi:hypothetical protein